MEDVGFELSPQGWVGFGKLGGVRKLPGGCKARKDRASLSVAQLGNL